MGKKSFRRMVAATKSELTDKELFLSPEFKDMVTTIVRGVSPKNHPAEVNIGWDSRPEAAAAYVAGLAKLYLNADNVLVQGEERLHRFKLLVGMLLHECGHMLWTDVNWFMKITSTPAYLAKYAPRVAAFVGTSNARLQQINGLVHNIQNMGEDGFIELLLLKLFPGYGAYLAQLREKQLSDLPTLGEMRANDMEEIGIIFNMILTYAKYAEVKISDESEKDDELYILFEDVKPLLDDLRTCGSFDGRCILSYKVLDKIWDILSKLFKKQNQPQQSAGDDSEEESSTGSGSSSNGNDSEEGNSTGSGSGNGSGDSEETEETETNGSSESSENGSSEETEGNGTGSNSSTSQSSGSAGNGAGGTPTGSSEETEPYEPTDEEIEQALKSMTSSAEGIGNDEEVAHGSLVSPQKDATNGKSLDSEATPGNSVQEDEQKLSSLEDELAEAKTENQLNQEEAREMASDPAKMHQGYPVVMTEPVPFSKNKDNLDESDTDMLVEDIRKSSQAAAKKFVSEYIREINDRKEYGWDNCQYSGNKVSAPYREDRKVFSKRVLPDELGEVAIAVLVDESGSMACAHKYYHATVATATLYSGALALDNVKMAVYGHDYRFGSDDVRIRKYASFENKTKKALESIEHCCGNPQECNRDGAAIRAVLKILEKRPEAKKLLIVISDGAPYAMDYDFDYRDPMGSQSSRNVCEDIDDILLTYGKKGINLVVAGIGDSAENIKAVYTGRNVPKRFEPEFVAIENPSKMASTLVKVMKKYIES